MCGHSGRSLRDDIQSVACDSGQLDVRTTRLRPVQQLRCALFDGQHNAPVLHFGGSVSEQPFVTNQPNRKCCISREIGSGSLRIG